MHRDPTGAFHVRPHPADALQQSDSLRKLDPRTQWHNPVMFVHDVGSVLTTLLWLQALFGSGEAPTWFIGNVAIWLWFTALFANFAEALAEGRSKAQAARCATSNRPYGRRSSRRPTASIATRACGPRTCAVEIWPMWPAGELIPADGEVVRGAASVDEERDHG